MIVDTSALVAIVFQEPGYEALVAKLTADGPKGIGTPSLTELGIILASRLEGDAETTIRGLLQRFDIVQVPFGEVHWSEAVRAYRRFGKGNHRAALNFGDCFSYATARLAGLPLLFVGDDFTQTDIDAV